MKRLFYLLGLKESVHEHVNSCEICQMSKVEHVKSPGLLLPLALPNRAWEYLIMDFITGLSKSDIKTVIMMVVDRFTKYAHFFSLSHSFTAADVSQIFMENVYKLHGLPLSIVRNLT
jgi:hypothetical protein